MNRDEARRIVGRAREREKKPDLRGADLHGVNLRGINVCEADLSKADLGEADLGWAKLCRANLCWANLRGADLYRADFEGANLHGADLSAANLCGANLRWANLSGVIGLLDPATWLSQFGICKDGILVYKRIGSSLFGPPAHWRIEEGAFLTEVVNSCRTVLCGSGVSFGTREWCDKNYPDAELWLCCVLWPDLAGVVVPYNTDGRARCARLKLVKRIG